MKLRTIAAPLVALLALGGLAACADTTPADVQLVTRAEVDWTVYPDLFHEDILAAEESGDCAALQSAFDVASKLDLLEYLDEALTEAGCYK
jgi:hypothetical protein